MAGNETIFAPQLYACVCHLCPVHLHIVSVILSLGTGPTATPPAITSATPSSSCWTSCSSLTTTTPRGWTLRWTYVPFVLIGHPLVSCTIRYGKSPSTVWGVSIWQFALRSMVGLSLHRLDCVYMCFNPVHPIGNSFKKLKPCTKL